MATRAEQHKEIRESAIAYAGQGWHVFPVPPGTRKSYMSKKYSGGRRWGASNDVDEVRGFYKQWLKANIGIPTGELNGFFVVETESWRPRTARCPTPNKRSARAARFTVITNTPGPA